MQATLCSFDRCCGLFLDLSVSIHCLCSDTALVYLFKISGAWKKYVPFRFGRTFLCLEVQENRSDVGTPKVLIYMNFKSHELWLMPKVLSNSLCLNMARDIHEANSRQTLLIGQALPV